MDRRRALKLIGAGVGTVAAAGFARYRLLPPSPSAVLASAHDLSVQLFASLDSEARKLACVPYDHPLRQYHNRGVWGGGISGFRLDWDQRSLLTDLLYAGLSSEGRARLPNEYFLNWPGIHAVNVLFCGDPSASDHQVIVTGPHLNLRIGGKSREGVAFGGPLVYGDQRGNEVQGLPGNLYRYQFEIGHRLFESLSSAQRELAVQEESPIQTQIELLGANGSFRGVPLASASKESRAIAREVIDAILINYPEDDVAYAWRCLEENGGLEALFLSYYREGEVDRSGQFQIFRLEGPAAVLYFRGYPHVHAFINVAMNGDAPLSVGEELGANPSVLEKERVKALFEAAMLEATGADRAEYALDDVVGRLRTGVIRTGDIYNLESWQSFVEVAEVDGKQVARASRATTELRLRDAVIAHVKKHGFG